MKRLLSYTIIAAMLSGCGSYDKIPLSEDTHSETELWANTDTDSAEAPILPWQKLFLIPSLQKLIESGLERNSDLNIAKLQIDEVEAKLASAKRAFFPSLSLNANGNLRESKDEDYNTYSISAETSWEPGDFGELNNRKKLSATEVESSAVRYQAIRTQLIADIAECYFTLSALDKRLEIEERTLSNWRETVETLRKLKDVGKANEAAVLQAEAEIAELESAIHTTTESISEAENGLSALLATPSLHVEREDFDHIALGIAEKEYEGFPLNALSTCPDVRLAELELKKASYSVGIARSAFYPQLRLQGSLGWTDENGVRIQSPGQWIINAMSGLTAPIFNRGKNMANLKTAVARQKEANIAFGQSLLNAGKEVNDALIMYQTAKRKMQADCQRISTSQEAVKTTELLLFHSSSTSYLELLAAQRTLLEAEQDFLNNKLHKHLSIVRLFRTLGI